MRIYVTRGKTTKTPHTTNLMGSTIVILNDKRNRRQEHYFYSVMKFCIEIFQCVDLVDVNTTTTTSIFFLN